MGNGFDNDQSGSNYIGKFNEISVKNAFFLSFSNHEWGRGFHIEHSVSNCIVKGNSVKNAFFLSFSAHESGGADFTLSIHSQIISEKSKKIQSKTLFFYPSAPMNKRERIWYWSIRVKLYRKSP